MRVTVHIYPSLRRHLPGRERTSRTREWEMPEGADVRQLIDRLHLPEQVRVTVLVNDRSVDPATGLRPDDGVLILPQMGGG